MVALLEGPSSAYKLPFSTFVEAMEAVRGLEARGFTFVDERGGDHFISYAGIVRRAARVAHALQAQGLRKGDRVLIVMTDNESFIPVFLGAVWGGIVPVPIFPPLGLGGLKAYVEHAANIARAAGARVAVVSRMVHRILGALYLRYPALRALLVAEKVLEGTAEARPVPVSPADTCFVQFTSGSTSAPRGVNVTHGSLLANTAAIGGEGMDLESERDRGVSWLPLYHDMGLIGFVLTPLCFGVSITSMSPLTFLKRPHIWIRKLSEHRGTIGYAPNFAFGLCTKRVRGAHLEGIDLSSWRIAGCGAEPISAETLQGFADHFAPVGFRPEAMFPSYGMAEATLAITFVAGGEGTTIDRVDADLLAGERRAVSLKNGTGNPARLVGCGRPFAEHAIAIVDRDGAVLGERQVGEIRVKGPSVTPGYINAPEASARTFRDGWLYTGDLGYVADGQLYICGRKKEVIIINGRNYYPQDLERAVWKLDGIRTGNVVAFGVPGATSEELIVAAEIKDAVTVPDVLSRNIRTAISESFGLKVYDVALLPAGGLPKTSSGKLQRRKARLQYLGGELGQQAGRGGKLDALKSIATSQAGFVRSFLKRVSGTGR